MLPIASIVTRLRAAGCVFAEDEAALLVAAAETPATDGGVSGHTPPDRLAEMVERRVAGVPLEHILGWVEFCGMRVLVEPGVFVPRKRTEFLVRQAAPVVRADSTVLDLCCGCGAVGVALIAGAPGAGLHAADVDPPSVRCARRNVERVGGTVYQGDLYAALPSRLRGRVDVLVANTPYVPSGAIGLLPPEARLHEPMVALDGGADGLGVLRRVVADAPGWLAPGGRLFLELGEDQIAEAEELIGAAGLVATLGRDEESGGTVISGARR